MFNLETVAVIKPLEETIHQADEFGTKDRYTLEQRLAQILLHGH
jgi:hypothetical protein